MSSPRVKMSSQILDYQTIYYYTHLYEEMRPFSESSRNYNCQFSYIGEYPRQLGGWAGGQFQESSRQMLKGDVDCKYFSLVRKLQNTTKILSKLQLLIAVERQKMENSSASFRVSLRKTTDYMFGRMQTNSSTNVSLQRLASNYNIHYKIPRNCSFTTIPLDYVSHHILASLLLKIACIPFDLPASICSSGCPG